MANNKARTLPDGTKCYSGPNCKRHGVKRSTAESKNSFINTLKAPTGLPKSAGNATVQRMNITDIAEQSVWDEAIKQKYINVQSHPTLPYDIYDYSQTCQYDRYWNEATLAARGLIVNRETGDIVGRPLGKFFNHGEPGVPTELLTGPVTVSDKNDGSMGVSYPTSDGLRISTRGSFKSEQAEHATALYKEKYEGNWEPKKNHTYVWEIIYPTNRIVVNYGDKDDLVLISRVNIKTGKSVPASQVNEWKGEKVQEFPYTSLAEALSAEPRENAEGFVVHYTDTDVRVKVKQEDYVQFHRVITGASARRIHEMIGSGANMDEWTRGLPEEFTDYVNTTRTRLVGEQQTKINAAKEAYKGILADLPEGYSQKDFALKVAEVSKAHPDGAWMRGALFSTHQGRDEAVATSAWESIRPGHEKPFWNLNGKTDESLTEGD